MPHFPLLPILEALRSASDAADAFGAEARIACPPGCGACCESPEVEASIEGCLPLARDLAARGAAEEHLAAARARLDAGERRCALYRPDPLLPGRGRCAEYALRPLVCRLFGFAARRDRDGRPELAACRTMRAAAPQAVQDACDAVRSGALAAPLFSTHESDVAGAAGRAHLPLLPINAALACALERALLEQHLARMERGARTGAAPPCEPGGAGPAQQARPPRVA